MDKSIIAILVFVGVAIVLHIWKRVDRFPYRCECGNSYDCIYAREECRKRKHILLVATKDGEWG